MPVYVHVCILCGMLKMSLNDCTISHYYKFKKVSTYIILILLLPVHLITAQEVQTLDLKAKTCHELQAPRSSGIHGLFCLHS